MRNFWAEIEIDGRKTVLKGGPANKFGGMTIRLYQRDNGESVNVLNVSCMAQSRQDSPVIKLATVVNGNTLRETRR